MFCRHMAASHFVNALGKHNRQRPGTKSRQEPQNDNKSWEVFQGIAIPLLEGLSGASHEQQQFSMMCSQDVLSKVKRNFDLGREFA